MTLLCTARCTFSHFNPFNFARAFNDNNVSTERERERPAEQWARDSRRPRELWMVPSASPCVALSSARTNETVNQRSTILIDPRAT